MDEDVIVNGKADFLKMDVNTAETVIINVGGVKNEVLLSTLQTKPGTLLSNSSELAQYYRCDKNDFFFDRDPQAFRMILNYYRTGELHIPTDSCGPLLKFELDFWRIRESEIQQCCVLNYFAFNDQKEALSTFEEEAAKQENWLQLAEESTGFKRWQYKTWAILDDPSSSLAAMVVAAVSVIFTMLSVFEFVAETHVAFQEPLSGVELKHFQETFGLNQTNQTGPGTRYYKKAESLVIINYICIAYFIAEIVVRFFICPRKLKFFLSVFNWIDILVLCPFFVDMITHETLPGEEFRETWLDFVHILRIARIFKLFRILSYYIGMQVLLYTVKASYKDLFLIVTFICTGILIFAPFIYYADRESFKDIPVGIWWALITITTVGYGDYYPTTAWGYVVGSFCAISGILVLAFSVPAVVQNFLLYYSYAHVRQNIIPSKTPKRTSSVSSIAPKDVVYVNGEEASETVTTKF